MTDRRKEAIEEKFAASTRRQVHEFEKISVVAVPGWPSMGEVVYEDEYTGPTPVGFAFNADAVAYDISGALTSRGIVVESLLPEDVQSLDDLDAADAGIFVFPVRHKQLPWQVLAFFDQVVEPRVSSRQSPLNGIPMIMVALGNTEEDVDAALAHLQQLAGRYGFEFAVAGGVVYTPDRLALYEQVLDLADQIIGLEVPR